MSPKRWDFQVPLYPFEKQFNLLSVLVEGRYIDWFVAKIIGQEDEYDVVFRVQEFENFQNYRGIFRRYFYQIIKLHWSVW
jgi:hypothetical protein